MQKALVANWIPREQKKPMSLLDSKFGPLVRHGQGGMRGQPHRMRGGRRGSGPPPVGRHGPHMRGGGVNRPPMRGRGMNGPPMMGRGMVWDGPAGRPFVGPRGRGKHGFRRN